MVKTSEPFRFNIFAFVLGFSIGLLYVYIATPQKKVIVKYPTPYNAGKIVYHDDTDDCYIYENKEVPCPKTTVPQPIV